MKKHLMSGLMALVALGLMTPSAHALRNLSLKQQGELPRDQFVNLIDPDHFKLDLCVVQFTEDTRIRLRDGQLISLEGRDTGAVANFLKAHPEITVERLFQSMEENALDAYVERGERMSGVDVADLNNFYVFRVATNRQPKALLQDLLKLDLVQTCYYEPIGMPATCGVDTAPATPTYVASQDYREAAPTGVDIDYAWAHDPSHGNGISSYWFQDLEWGWCEDHEDFASTFSIRNPPDSGVAGDYNHGTAVASIVGACDDAKGVTGLVPEVRLTARVVSNHVSEADALIAIGNDLVTGETYLIEWHGQGPDQGTTCVCNCSQFRYIAMEYWTAPFNAILANSTNGRFCIEAAGNGSMDLDWSGYGGAFDLGFRDSQAIVVGAGTSGATHNPECWTNHGTRISAQGWGDGVYAAGYGDLFNQANCQQDYTNSFSGTSSASPVVTGPAISLALIHLNQEGSYPSPTTLRSRLTIHGTPQGPTDTWKEINVLPNMKGILAPDLTAYTPAGWANFIVPSDVSGTTVLPANLLPSPAPTYFDWGWVNWSHYSETGAYQNHVLADDVMRAFNNMANHGTFTYHVSGDINMPMRGGLHYIRLFNDQSSVVDESDESNNNNTIGYRWDPIALTSNSPVAYSRGPKRTPSGYSTSALDGFGNGGNFTGFWDVFAVMPSVGTADYDLYMYNADPTPTTGWTTTVAVSGGVSTVDFVGCNNNTTSDGDFVGVINYNDSGEDYTIEGEGSVYKGGVPAVPTLMQNGSLDAGEILDVMEFTATAGAPVRFSLDITGGTADVALLVYGPTSTYFARSASLFTISTGGAGNDAAGTFTPATSGYHAVVLCKNLRTDLSQYASYNLYWGSPSGDLTHAAQTGWTQSLVARNSGVGTTGVLPATLAEGATVADAGLTNIGSGTMAGGSNLIFYLDGPQAYTSGDFSALAPAYMGSISNRLIGNVKGGRHELASVLDANSEVQEEMPAGESNNAQFNQFVWAPHALANNTPESRSAAPNWANQNNPTYWMNPNWNQDAYVLSTTYWTGVAVMPSVAADQLDMTIYNNADSGITTGLVGQVDNEFPPAGEIAIVVANGNVLGNNQNYHVGVLNNWGYPGVISTSPYTVQLGKWNSDMVVGAPRVGTLAGDATTGGQLVHFYDLNLTAGQSYPVHLFNNSAVNLGVAFFTAGEDFTSLDNAEAEFNSGAAGVDETGTFTPSVSGWHGVAVYRSTSADLGPAAPYSLVVGSWSPAAVADLHITMTDTDGSDLVLIADFTWSDVATDANGNPLAVDHYNFYWCFDPWTPGSWYYYTSTTASELLGVACGISVQPDLYFMVTAVDENGTLVASSNPALAPAVVGSTPLVSRPVGQLNSTVAGGATR